MTSRSGCRHSFTLYRLRPTREPRVELVFFSCSRAYALHEVVSDLSALCFTEALCHYRRLAAVADGSLMRASFRRVLENSHVCLQYWITSASSVSRGRRERRHADTAIAFSSTSVMIDRVITVYYRCHVECRARQLMILRLSFTRIVCHSVVLNSRATT